MDSFDKYPYKNKIPRQKTPSTNYSSFSSPPISPVHFSSSEPQTQEKLSPISLTFQNSLNFQDLVARYFFMNELKEKVNASCLALLDRLDKLHIRRLRVKKTVQLSNFISKNNYFDLTPQYLDTLESRNKAEKVQLALIIQSYYEKLAQMKEVNFLLKETVLRTKMIENLQNELEKKSLKVQEYKKIMTGLTIDSEFLFKHKQELVKELSALQSKNQDIRSLIKSTGDWKEKNQNVENTVAFIDAKANFETNQLFNLEKKLFDLEERSRSKRTELKNREKTLSIRIQRFLERSEDLKRLKQDLNTKKSIISGQSERLASLSSSLSVKEKFLDQAESSLLVRYEILEKTSLIENLY